MNWLDVVLAVLTGLAAWSGFRKGFARVGIGFASTVLGIVSALWFYGSAGAALAGMIKSRTTANLVGFLGIVLAFIILGGLLGALVGRLLRWAGLSWLDRLAGGLFGAVRGMAVGVALVMALLAFSPSQPPDSVVNSRLAPYFIDAARAVTILAPKGIKDAVGQSYGKVLKIWTETLEKGVHRMPTKEL